MLLSRHNILLSTCLLLGLISQGQVSADSLLVPTDARSLASSNDTSSAQCESQGLSGTCNSQICCCYKGGGGFVKITPNGNSCKRSFGGTQVWVTIILAVIVIVVTLAASCYFNGRVCISPYKPATQRPAGSLAHPY